jgi:membrane-associated HD superfamily phosphohydrolase
MSDDGIFGTLFEGSDEPKQPVPEEDTVDRLKKNAVSLFLVILAIIILVAMAVFGAFRNADMQAVMIYVALFLIIISILVAMKDKLFTALIAMAILAIIYYAEGWVLQIVGAIPAGFSWGILTMCLMSLFVYWVGLDNKITPKDLTIILVFVIVCFLLNANGWMERGNDITWGLVSGVKDIAGQVIAGFVVARGG